MQTKRNNRWQASGPGLSSTSDDWATPAVFAALDAKFHFDLDVCASATNAKCADFFATADDALAQERTATFSLNPPYGRGIGTWIKKASPSSAATGAAVVCLVPARTDTAWWHEQVMPRAREFRRVRGRRRFGAGDAPAPLPSAVVVYWPDGGQRWFTTWTPSRRKAASRRGRDNSVDSMKDSQRPTVTACPANGERGSSERRRRR